MGRFLHGHVVTEDLHWFLEEQRDWKLENCKLADGLKHFRADLSISADVNTLNETRSCHVNIRLTLLTSQQWGKVPPFAQVFYNTQIRSSAFLQLLLIVCNFIEFKINVKWMVPPHLSADWAVEPQQAQDTQPQSAPHSWIVQEVRLCSAARGQINSKHIYQPPVYQLFHMFLQTEPSPLCVKTQRTHGLCRSVPQR